MHELNIKFINGIIHIVRNYLRICCYYRAVVMVRLIVILNAFIVDARIKNELFSVFHEPFDMPVNKLRRITGSV